MTTTPTQNPVPSEAAVDLKFNAGKIDEFVTSFVLTYTDRLGRDHLTIEGMRDIIEKAIKAFGFITMDSFEDGATLDNSSQVLRWESNGEYYRWDGSFPKVVPAGSTPATTGGIGTGAWVSVGDAALRTQLINTASGYGDALIGVKSTLPLSVGRTQHDKNEETVSVKDFGAVGDGVTNDTTSFINAFASGRNVLVPQGGNYLISPGVSLNGYMLLDGNLIINSTCSLNTVTVVRSGRITVNSGFTLTLTNELHSPRWKIFYGSGAVVGLRYVMPEWWGALGDNTFDCSPALNAASACVAASASVKGVRPKIELGSGKFLISSTWTIPASANIGIELAGQGIIFSGTRIVAGATFTGTSAISLVGSTDSTQAIVDIYLHDFGLEPQTKGSGPTSGLAIGTATGKLIGLKESVVSDVFISNFTQSLHLTNIRQIKFSRLGIWNDGMTTASNCIRIQANGGFCGDLSFENCQLVNNHLITDSHCISFYVVATYNPATAANQIAGVRFTECVIYPAYQQVHGYALNGGWLQDLFFTNCQWDGDSSTIMSFTSGGTGTSLISDIQVVNNYMYGGNISTSMSQIEFITSGTCKMYNIRVDENTLGAGKGRVINIAGPNITGVHINENYLINFQSASNPAIQIGNGASRLHICGNLADTNAGLSFPYLIQLDAGVNRFVVTDNLASGVAAMATINDLTSGATKVVANNL